MQNNTINFLYKHYGFNNDINMIIESKLQTIIESQEEIYKDQMKKFFPTIWNNVKGNLQYYFPYYTSKLKNEQKIISKYIKNLDFEIRLNNHSMRNAYTYPWLESKKQVQATVIPLFGWLYFLINGYNKVGTQSNMLKPKVGDGVVTFPNSGNLKVMAFQTKGFLTDLEERQRAAVMLHEIGHWRKATPALNSMTTKLITTMVAFPPIALILSIAHIIFNRTAEKQADLFAKQCGFGDDLAEALDRLALRPRTDVSWIVKTNDWLIKIMMHIQNVIDKYLPIFTYPSIAKRKKYLKDKSTYNEEYKIEELDKIINLINEGKMLDLSLKLLQKPLNIVDKTIGKKMNIIFPVK